MQGADEGKKQGVSQRRWIMFVILALCAGQFFNEGICQGQVAGETKGAAEKSLAEYKFQFDVARSQLEKPRQVLNGKYREALGKLKVNFQGKGNAIGVAAVEKAVADLDKETVVAVKSPIGLKQVQEIYLREREKVEAQEAKALALATDAYRGQLVALGTKLKEARLLDDALLVKAALEKVPVVGASGIDGNQAMRKGSGFFGVRPNGNRILFVIDHSGSLNGAQMGAIAAEVENGLLALKVGTLYQVIIFAGGAMFAEPGWKISRRDSKVQFVIEPGGKKHRFYSVKGSAFDFEFSGTDSELPTSDWIPATSANIQSTLKVLRSEKQIFGTDWELALRIGHHLSPPPDVIFFISDGAGGNAPDKILDLNRRKGSPKIFAFAMQTPKGAMEFSKIARGTGGEFRVVLKDGEVITGEEYLADPGKFASRLIK